AVPRRQRRAADACSARGRPRASRGTSTAHATGMPRRVSSQTIDALDLLAEQHADVEDLFAQIASTKRDRRTLFDELADKLAAHTTIEEKLFYPAAMSKQTEALLRDAVDDHLEVKRILAELLDMDSDDEEFDEVLAELEQAVSHHVRVEEDELFPIVRAQLTEDALAGLGNELLAMFDEQMATSPREHVVDETNAPAPLPPR